MAVGYWNLSRTQVLDQNDNLIPGARASFFVGGTGTIPMTVFSSATMGDANEHPQPVLADGNARWPQVFFDAAFLYYDVQVTDAAGSLLFADQSVPIIAQATDAGGGTPPVPVDQNALAKTGDVKLKFGTQPEAGWVRMNGLTISKGGVGGSGTERANDDCFKLFEYLWNNHNNTICPLAGGVARTSVINDWNTGQQITLPDMRHRSPFGIGAMGNSVPPVPPRIADGFIDTVTAGAANVVGVAGGDDDIALTTAQIPAHSHGATGVPAEAGPPAVALKEPLKAANHGHPARYGKVDGTGDGYGDGAILLADPTRENYIAFTGGVSGAGAMDDTVGHQIGGSGLVAITGNTSLAGGPAAALTGVSDRHENMPPFMLFMFLIKL